jgi:hypothetical protein
MDVDAALLEPPPTPPGQSRRLRHRRETEDPCVEGLGRVLGADRHGELHMVDGGERPRGRRHGQQSTGTHHGLAQSYVASTHH